MAVHLCLVRHALYCLLPEYVRAESSLQMSTASRRAIHTANVGHCVFVLTVRIPCGKSERFTVCNTLLVRTCVPITLYLYGICICKTKPPPFSPNFYRAIPSSCLRPPSSFSEFHWTRLNCNLRPDDVQEVQQKVAGQVSATFFGGGGCRHVLPQRAAPTAVLCFDPGCCLAPGWVLGTLHCHRRYLRTGPNAVHCQEGKARQGGVICDNGGGVSFGAVRRPV